MSAVISSWELTIMRQFIYRAMHQSDDLVVEFDYTDARGAVTHRVVSPIRFLGRERFLGLCLSREEPRQFYLDRCQNVRLAPAADFLMPVAMAS
jgi:predicted DNA-binding transcriptional regulator YafY